MFIIKTQTKFETAHRLQKSYTKTCQSPQGHSYKIDWYCRSDTLNEGGVVVDFTKIKEITRKVINDYDHILILQKEDDLTKQSIAEKTTTMNLPPTTEHIAYHLFYLCKDKIPTLYKVRVWETEDSYAEYTTEG